MGLHDSTRMVSERMHHIVHLLDRQDNSDKGRLDQTSTANARNADIALTNRRVSTVADMMTKPPFFRKFVRPQVGSELMRKTQKIEFQFERAQRFLHTELSI